MEESIKYIFVKDIDKELINVIHRILFRCGLKMARQFLFHWIPPYSKRAIRRDCRKKNVILVWDENLHDYTSTFQMTLTESKELYVGKIATAPQYEGKGIGRSNMLFMERFAQKHNCKKIELDVYAKSKHAISFYKRNGFKITGEKKTIRFKEYVMEKQLL